MSVELKRVIDLSRTEANKIYARQRRGTLKVYFDNKGYQCFDINEQNKPHQVGRPRKQDKTKQ